MSKRKFIVGDRVQMTQYGLKQGLGVYGDTKGPCFGTVIGLRPPAVIVVKRDGLKGSSSYHQDLWRHVSRT